jgi:cytoskeletal protein CcmA (bactofilin family)
MSSTPPSTPLKPPEAEPSRSGVATIGKAVKVKGQIFSHEDLYVDGDVEGTVELLENKLTIGPNGKVQASLKAREVIVLGSVQGNVEASERLELRKDAHLVGDTKTARIAIEDGAYIKGSIDIVKADLRQPAASPNPQAATASARAHPVKSFIPEITKRS